MSGFELHGSTYIQCGAISIYCHTNDSLQCWSDLIGSDPCVFQDDNNNENEKEDNAGDILRMGAPLIKSPIVP